MGKFEDRCNFKISKFYLHIHDDIIKDYLSVFVPWPRDKEVEIKESSAMTTSISTRRILILGRRNSGKLSLVKSLTSTLPPSLTHEDTPHAGLTHSIALKTRYYSTEAGIWIDEIPEDSETWLNEYLSEEATPVLQSLAAIILTVNPGVEDYRADLEILQKLNERGEEVEWDGIGFVVGKNTSTVSNLELVAQCDEATFEYVDMNKSGTNEFGGNYRSSKG